MEPTRSLLLLFLLAFSASGCLAESFGVNGHQVEVMLTPDQPMVMVGEPTYLSFKVENLSDESVWVLDGAGYGTSPAQPAAFTLKVVRADGQATVKPDPGQSLGGIDGAHEVPAHGTYTYRFFLPLWARFEQPGTYQVMASRVLPLADDAGRAQLLYHPVGAEIKAATQLTVVPYDSEKMGWLIDRLGDTVLHAQGNAAETAAHTLSYVDDPRVVAYFAEAAKKPDYSMKFQALGALGAYNDTAAFQALQAGLKTTGQDIGARDELAAGNIQQVAAMSLEKSSYPGAKEYLLSQRSTVGWQARHVLLLMVMAMPLETALPIVREMTNDPSDFVRDEAKRNLIILAGELPLTVATLVLQTLVDDPSEVVSEEAIVKLVSLTQTPWCPRTLGAKIW